MLANSAMHVLSLSVVPGYNTIAAALSNIGE
jgi:hypothetical protein